MYVETELACEVIRQAMDDACRPIGSVTGHGSTPLARDCEIAEACAFWADADGPWRESRVIWCEAAGLDPDAAREGALKRIAETHGACITRWTTWRRHLPKFRDGGGKNSEARREMAVSLYRRRQAGISCDVLRAEAGVSRVELNRLFSVARAAIKRSAA